MTLDKSFQFLCASVSSPVKEDNKSIYLLALLQGVHEIIKGPEQYQAHANSMCGIYNNVIVICFVIVPVLSFLTGYDENQMTEYMLYSFL